MCEISTLPISDSVEIGGGYVTFKISKAPRTRMRRKMNSSLALVILAALEIVMVFWAEEGIVSNSWRE